MKSLYVLRHGQTEFNVVGRLQGRLDSPLTALGREQAVAMGRTLAKATHGTSDWCLLTSPLPRARATAELVSRELGQLPVIEDACLQEVAFGEWEGRDDAQIKAQWPERYGRGVRDDWLFAAPGGESLDEAFARAKAWLARPELPERTIMVSHGLFGQLLRGCYLGLSVPDTLALDRPHGTVFLLHDGVMQRIECDVAHA